VRVEGWLADMQEMSLEHLGDIKAASIAEWVAIDVVRRAIQKHFKSFLMTYTDENGQSVYGQRIKHLGESESCLRSNKLSLTNSQL
jgi:DNA replication licensing factor MCM2